MTQAHGGEIASKLLLVPGGANFHPASTSRLGLLLASPLHNTANLRRLRTLRCDEQRYSKDNHQRADNARNSKDFRCLQRGVLIRDLDLPGLDWTPEFRMRHQ